MPNEYKKGSAKSIDNILRTLADELKIYVDGEAANGRSIHHASVRKRLFLAMRAAGVTPIREAISQDDWCLDAATFADSVGRFTPYHAPIPKSKEGSTDNVKSSEPAPAE